MEKQIKLNGAAFEVAYVQGFATPKDFVSAQTPEIYANQPEIRTQLLTDVWKVGQSLKKKK
jgi:hypothetical protein